MKVKVRGYKLTPTLFDSIRGTYLEKVHTGLQGEVNVFFDEDMYITNTGFTREIYNITTGYIDCELTECTMKSVEYKLNSLLEKYRDRGELFSGAELRYLNKEGMICLNKEGMICLNKDCYFDEY